jgi:hypothetical protein
MNAPHTDDTLIAPGLRAFLQRIVDYAGMFPPADLPLHEAMENFLSYRTEPERWMLNRFVIPTKRLDELRPFRQAIASNPPVGLSVLGQGGATVDTFLEAFTDDLDRIDTCIEDHNSHVRPDVMEVRLPTTLLNSFEMEPVARFLEAVDSTLAQHGLAHLDIFFEVPLTDDTASQLPQVLPAFASANANQPVPEQSILGLKVRCGGMEPELFPSVEQVARAIVACRDTGVRFKATAGLHHPTRHHDEQYEVMRHGFFNVFGAAVLAAEHDLDVDGVSAILREENADTFTFTQEGMQWGPLSASVEDISHSRAALAHSFGSCSFVEPVEDLRALSLM